LPQFNSSSNLVIPAGLSTYPALAADESIYGLTIASGASFSLNGHTLSVGCNIYNSSTGQILYGANNSSGIIWNGSSASQTFTGTNTANTAQLGTMTVNNSVGGTVTITGGPVDIYSTLTITNGNLVIGASPAALTLKSMATQSASVGVMPVGSTITGNVNVERYITGGTATYRGYRLLSSPVYVSAVSGNNVYSINYLKNSIFLTATSTSGGFDNISAANPTLYLYRENMTPLYTTFLNSNFKGINNINLSPTYSMDDASNPSINIPVGNGYLCFFRGNRTSTTFAAETVPSYVPQTVTLSTSGTLNQGQITVKDWFTPASSTLSYTPASPAAVKGYNLVGNPYASSIDWENFQSTTSTTGIYGTSVGTTIYMLDPVSKNFGAYVKGGGGIGTNNASNIISSGQGFFVVTTCSCATLIFNEGAKTNTQVVSPKLLMGKPADQVVNNQYLRLQLAKDSVNTDDILLRFTANSSTAYVPDQDAPYKLGYGAVSLSSLSSDHISLAIKVQSLPKTSETISLTVNAKANGIYTLNMKNIVDIPPLFDIWLMDAYKMDSLDMRHNTTYAFNLYKADTNSYGSHRFSLVIRQNPAWALHLLDFTAAKLAGGTQIVWKTENEENYTNFTVERSTDNGKTFDVLGGTISSAQGTYSFLDKNPLIAADGYRLKLEDMNGTISYSKVVILMYSNLSNNITNNNISLYPNPAGSTINLSIDQIKVVSSNANATSYDLNIINNNGSIVKTVISSPALSQVNISNLLPGTYIVQVVNSNGKSLVGKSKFVKL
ncbi:MAG TPA: T9SS type A sorting domain-containing protein, partial [Mucilaginibacter sp.]|nr:T9SS type A sorting domain-containing protein [Mucilaginibacter sp.]